MTDPSATADFEERVQMVCHDFSATSLATLPDVFSRLAFLASLRDFSTGGYVHWGLSRTYGEEVAQRALQLVHHQLFREAGTLPLPELTQQVRDFLAPRADGGAKLMQSWQRDFAYHLLVPMAVSDLELENFRINFEAVLAVLTQKDPA